MINGWASIKLQEVAGKGQHYTSPLYIVPGEASAHLTFQVCTDGRRMYVR